MGARACRKLSQAACASPSDVASESFYRTCCFPYGCFFFSSRRRHTSCYRDWSSDVCSSDLVFYGVSANRWRIWEIDDARHAIGYEPRDDAEAWRGEVGSSAGPGALASSASRVSRLRAVLRERGRASRASERKVQA